MIDGWVYTILKIPLPPSTGISKLDCSLPSISTVPERTVASTDMASNKMKHRLKPLNEIFIIQLDRIQKGVRGISWHLTGRFFVGIHSAAASHPHHNHASSCLSSSWMVWVTWILGTSSKHCFSYRTWNLLEQILSKHWCSSLHKNLSRSQLVNANSYGGVRTTSYCDSEVQY